MPWSPSHRVEGDIDALHRLGDVLLRVVHGLVGTQAEHEVAIARRPSADHARAGALGQRTARWPTPPEAPAINAACPLASPPRSNSPCHAVIPDTGMAAARSKLRPTGFLAIAAA